MCGRRLCDVASDLGGLSRCYVKEKCGGSQGHTQSRAYAEPCPLPSLTCVIMFTARTPYSGRSRKLVVALDIGTTFSGAAYAILDPGQVPRIQPVTRQAFLPSLTQ